MSLVYYFFETLCQKPVERFKNGNDVG